MTLVRWDLVHLSKSREVQRFLILFCTTVAMDITNMNANIDHWHFHHFENVQKIFSFEDHPKPSRNTFSEPERKTKLVFNLRTDTVGAPPGRNTWEIHDPRVVIIFLSTHQPKPENVLHVYVLLRQTKIPNIISVDETSSTPLAKKGFPPTSWYQKVRSEPCPCFVYSSDHVIYTSRFFHYFSSGIQRRTGE